MGLFETCSSLVLLLREWKKYVENEKSGGRGGQSGDFSEHKDDYNLLLDSLIQIINQLGLDWFFLQMLGNTIDNSNATELIRDKKSVILKVHSVAYKILRDLTSCVAPDEKLDLKRSQEVLSLLRNCQRKTDQLTETGIQEDLKDLSKKPILSKYPYNFFWLLFPPSVRENLRSFNDGGNGGLDKKLVILYNELVSFCTLLDHFHIKHTWDDFIFQTIFGDAVSVIMRIVVHSCYIWFNRKDPQIANVITAELVGLLQEIDHTNVEFLRLNLRCLEDMYKEKMRVRGDCYEVEIFCRYLLNWFDRKDLEKELSSLVILCFEDRIEEREVNMYHFFVEIEAFLLEVAFSHRAVQQDLYFLDGEQDSFSHDKQKLAEGRKRDLPAALPPCPELLAKLCLLKAELFLRQQLNTCNASKLFGDDRFLKVDIIITSLRTCNKDLFQYGNTGYMKQSLLLAEELANEIESLQKYLIFKKITGPLVKRLLLQLLLKIVFFKVESILAELLKSSGIAGDMKMDQIKYLVEELKHLKVVLKMKLALSPSDDETVITQVELVAREITFLFYLCLPDHKRFEKFVHSLPQLVDKVNHVKAKLGERSQQFPKSIFPKTSVLGFFDFLSRNIREFLKCDFKSVAPVKNHFQEVSSHLDSLKLFLLKVKDSEVKLGELMDFRNRIIDAAYKLEYVVDSIEVDGHFQDPIWLYDILDDIKLLDQQVHKIAEMYCAGENVPDILSQMISNVSTPKISQMLGVLVNEDKVIVDHLICGSSERNVFSIVGMPGVGKTTMARKVYNNPNVMCHFHRRAWGTVSQTYSKRALLLELLSHILEHTDDINQLTDDDLLSTLRQCLLRNKYLIVMDDMWDIAAWNDLENFFPDDNNGSRILITSHCDDVAFKMKPDSDPHLICPLSDVESWKLLKNKIFISGDCPKELLKVGMEIAQHCQGLPLAVVTIAGLLVNLEKNKDTWKNVSESLSSEIIRNPVNRCKEILELCYKHLPEYLRACFIYLGVFLEDQEIPVRKLIPSWIAEGFIQETEGKSLEEVAEDYLMELINKSLVSIYKTRSNGKVKTCHLHDLLRDLCLSKAKEENFQQLVTKNDEPYTSFHDSEYDLELGSKNLSAPIVFDSYRLGFYVKRPHFIDSQPSGQVARSLTFFASSDSEPKCPYDISFICHNFKLLRVLELESIMASSFPVEIGLMIQLRYLSLSGYMQSIPSSISNLWKLQTLVVKGSRKVILPETIWSMVKLRHLHVNNHAAFNMQGIDKDLGSSFHLNNLVSCSTPSLSSRGDRWRILKRLPNLRKLRCIFCQSGDSSDEMNEIIRWNFLTHLESLKIICFGGTPNSEDFLLPQSLQKLTLSKFCLQESHLSVIGELPNLGVLKLRAGTFEGQKWEMQEGEFKELKFLELDTVNLVDWDASHDHFPCLEQLVLRNCKDLQRIPSNFVYIATLQKVEVHWCRKSVEASALEIGDETRDIKVDISRI